MNPLELARTRKSTKVFDPTRKIDPELWQEVLDYLRLSPSSTNLQPWKFLIAETDQAKQKILGATQGNYSANAAKILNASHVLVMCSRASLTDAEVFRVAEQEFADGRIRDEQSKMEMHQRRLFFVDLHRQQKLDVEHWTAKQVYLALGHLLIGARGFGIDACPIEGFDLAEMDQILDLPNRGLKSVVVVALGYADAQDWNQNLPKSRFGEGQVFEQI